jgi:hypothetical protein
VGTALTFYANAQTTSARSSPIPQLTCNGGNGCKYSNEVENVQCTCTGIDDHGNAQYKCESSLPNYLELGTTLVSCEGCTSSSDSQLLVGSCGLYYTLNYNANGDFDDTHVTYDDDENIGEGFITFLKILFLIVIIIMMIAVCASCCKYVYHHNGYSRLPLRHDSFREVESIPIMQATPISSTNIQPSAPPIRTVPKYSQPQVYQSYQNPPRQDNSSFVNGMLVGEMVGGGRHENHLAQDVLLMNAMSGSSSGNNFVTGMMVGEALNSNHSNHSNVKQHHTTSHVPRPSNPTPVHHASGGHHVSVGHGGSMKR